LSKAVVLAAKDMSSPIQRNCPEPHMCEMLADGKPLIEENINRRKMRVKKSAEQKKRSIAPSAGLSTVFPLLVADESLRPALNLLQGQTLFIIEGRRQHDKKDMGMMKTMLPQNVMNHFRDGVMLFLLSFKHHNFNRQRTIRDLLHV
jgi:hypothetical protein